MTHILIHQIDRKRIRVIINRGEKKGTDEVINHSDLCITFNIKDPDLPVKYRRKSKKVKHVVILKTVSILF
jgi:hypothetical protein